jgi:putative hemolysin
MDPFPALIPFLLVVISGFLSLASVSINLARKPRLRLQMRLQQQQSETILFSLRIWNLLARFAGGVFGLYFFPSVYGIVLLALSFIIFSELLPRAVSSINPEKILLPLLSLLSVLALPWKPLYLLVSRFSDKRNMDEEEFLEALEEGEKTGAVETKERSMVEGVLYLGDRPVSAFMTHRADIEWLDINASREEVREKALAFHSQDFFPVIQGTQDNIAGVVSVYDILAALAEENAASSWKGLAAIMKKPRFIPETLSALKAFEAFKQENEYNLCVMDEYGGFAGSLRIRDLIEEIVGELGNAPEEKPVVAQEDGSWYADGSISLDELAEMPGLEEMEKEQGKDYHTLAGFILKLAGEIPRAGEHFTWEDFCFTIIRLDGNRIDKVRISKRG